MKKIILLSLIALPAVALASGHAEVEASRYFIQTGRESDFWPRVINFSIFAGVLYYLIANPIRNFFQGRSEGILSQLNEIEDKLKNAKNAQKEAQARLDASEKKADEILENAKAEAKLLAKKITTANENDLKILEEQIELKMSFEERKSAKEAIDKILSENLALEDINIDENKVVDIVSRKVA